VAHLPAHHRNHHRNAEERPRRRGGAAVCSHQIHKEFHHLPKAPVTSGNDQNRRGLIKMGYHQDDKPKPASERTKDSVTARKPNFDEALAKNKPTPKCGLQFSYSEADDGKLLRCRYCNTPMKLKLAKEGRKQ